PANFHSIRRTMNSNRLRLQITQQVPRLRDNTQYQIPILPNFRSAARLRSNSMIPQRSTQEPNPKRSSGTEIRPAISRQSQNSNPNFAKSGSGIFTSIAS